MPKRSLADATDAVIQSALPNNRGVVPPPEDRSPPEITVSLLREHAEDAAKATTIVMVGERRFVIGPYPRTLGVFSNEATEALREKDYKGVAEAIRVLRRGCPGCKGEIMTPGPMGSSVPHSDVMRVLDCFLAAGITDVNFVGSPPSRQHESLDSNK
jgi:hypothetical protein